LSKIALYPLYPLIPGRRRTYVFCLSFYMGSHRSSDSNISLIAGVLFAVVGLATDPLLATISGTHIWSEPGVYYGIPYQNYLGWYVMAYVIFQVIAIILWAQDRRGTLPQASPAARRKFFWIAPFSELSSKSSRYL